MEHSNISSEHALVGVELVLARSDFLDAFAELEASVAKVLRSCDQFRKGEPFSQRVKAFKLAEKTTLIAKQNHAKRDQIADEIGDLLQLRADIVHNRMDLLTIDGVLCASFVNVQDLGSRFPAQRILKLDDLKTLREITVKLSERIAQLNRVNPASSPPPPSPDAAGGP